MEIRHACFPITQNGGKEGGKHEKSHLRRPAAGHIQPWVCHQHGRNRHHPPFFLRSGHTGGVPFGGAAFPRLPQRPCHERSVLRGHGAHFADPLRAAVYRFLHRRCKERLHQGVSAPNHRIAVYRRKGRGLRRFRRADALPWYIHNLRLRRAHVPANGGLPQGGRNRAELLWQSNGDCAHVLCLGRVLVADGHDLRRAYRQQIHGIRIALRAVLSAHNTV